MCDPMVALSAVSNLLSIQAQNAQIDMQNQMRAANIKNATKAHATEQAQVNRRVVEEEAAVVQKNNELAMETMQAKGTAMASAANEGNSLNALMYDFDRQKARYAAIMQKNLQNVYSQGEAEKEGLSAGTASQMDAIAPAANISPVSAVVGTLGSALDAYHIYKRPRTQDIPSASRG